MPHAILRTYYSVDYAIGGAGVPALAAASAHLRDLLAVSAGMAGEQRDSPFPALYVVSPSRDGRSSLRNTEVEFDDSTPSLRRQRVDMEGGGGGPGRRSPPHLPDEVLGRILALLPLKSILQSRLVEKRWKTVSQDSSFRRAFSLVSGDLPAEYMQALANSQDFQGAQLLSSGGGLVLLSTSTNAGNRLFVVNPTMATVQRLPVLLQPERSSQHDFLIVGMVTTNSASGYMILAAQEGARPVRFQLYNSSVGEWRWVQELPVPLPVLNDPGNDPSVVLDRPPQAAKLPPLSFHALNVAFYNGNLHCLSVISRCDFHVLRLRPDHSWESLPGSFPPKTSKFASDFRCRPVLFENNGTLMVVGAQVTGPVVIRIILFVYNGEEENWTEVAFINEQVQENDSDLCGGEAYLTNTFFYLDVRGDHICLGAFPSLRNPEPKISVFSVSWDSWALAKLPQNEARKTLLHWQKRAMVFERI